MLLLLLRPPHLFSPVALWGYVWRLEAHSSSRPRRGTRKPQLCAWACAAACSLSAKRAVLARARALTVHLANGEPV